ncbi:MAG: Fur family transcriptional regulator [Rhodospirillaceae bacterium]|jgi:Fur family zinc uptake transcriptional regulator
MSFPAPRHDHGRCISGALKTAEDKSRSLGLRLTKTRRKVLEILWQSHKPLGAYDILDLLQENGRRPAPMVVYRALDFLIEAGLAHRLSSRNAFVGCSGPDDYHQAQFLICDQCGSAAELEARPIKNAIEETATSAGFRVQHHVIEITGICPNCQN